ncbi:site-specific integrase [Mameliella alba]|uniref:tyrosine-type recombinase/integrase n=1 Tax=Mameliella alba TaxID=561184 RepID=UPI001C96D8C6|nr:site-specific integrase [Mameliella alba]MBY6121836.1 site-specific integrase [Mameliella alba]
MPLKISKRGKTYYARGTIAGQHIRESTGCERRADALAWAEKRERQILDRHTLGVEATLTLAEIALEYMQTGGERRFLRPILEHFGPDFALADLDNGAITAAAEALYPEAKPATINRQLITPLRALVNYAAEDGRATPRKFRTRKGDNQRTRWLRPAEAERLIDAANPSLRVVILALLGTGARVRELLTSRVENWHPATGELWIEETKNGRPRMLRMPGRTRDALEAARPPAGVLIRKLDGAPYALLERQTPIKTAFSTARRKAELGPDVTPHVLRHTWATWYYSATKDFGGLLDLGGWQVPDMAMRYRKIAPDDLGDQLARFGWRFDLMGRDMPNVPTEGSQSLRLAK